MIRSSLCDNNDAYIYVKGTIKILNTEPAVASNNANKKVIFKNCAPFTNCTSKINYMQIDDGYDIDVVVHMYNLIEYSDIYLKTSGILWQYCRDESALNNADDIIDFPGNNNNSILFKFKQK